MNKAITDGVQLMPPAFANGLNVWSSGDGTPGSDTYANAVNAVFVPADQDFAGCLELQKTETTQTLRYMGETPLQPGCYLQIKARVKALAGNLPTVRIAGFAGGAGGAAVSGVTTTGPEVTLTTYGEVVEISAIVGVGDRGGVDLVWGPEAFYGHFGIDLTGGNGGIVRVDDIEIADVTSVFLRDLLSVVDVRDYGAKGDGSTDDAAAFEAADAAAEGRTILIPNGTYYLDSSVNLNAPVKFEGTVTMPDDKLLILPKAYDLPTYISAFGNETLAFKKAFQALLNNADHESLDMGGRKISISEPIDMQAAVANKTSFETRRVIRNGQIEAANSTAWDTEVVTSVATYDPSDARTLTNVANVANIAVGALVEGNGVGREVYVRSKNETTQEITLNAALYDAAGTQTFTFSRFKYMLDFSNFGRLSKFGMDNVEFQCNGRCSAINLAPTGQTFSLSECFVSRPKDRGITSIGGGCQGMLVDNCQFLSSEDSLDVPDRVSIALNVNANDAKLRNCRASRFRHFAVLAGSNSVILGNHFFQGDSVANGVRSAGIVLTETYTSTNFTGNYIDNCFVEWTNEHDSQPNFTTGFSFSAMSITDNVFLSGEVAPWFSYIVVKPHGTGHFLNGLVVSGNKFRSINGLIDRAERVDTSFADLDYSRFKHVHFHSNSYHLVTYQVENPLRVHHTQNSATQTWNIGAAGELPFDAYVRNVDAVVARSAITNGSNQPVFSMPYVETMQGADQNEIDLVWEEAVKGEVTVSLRIDN
ncbi:MAG: glycosyl hydrolase family 28-related protein [Pseudomonadota bacterium]